MELFNNIIWWLNIAVIIIVGGCFIFQLLFMLLCFLKPKQYKKATTYHKFTIVIRARNEEDVIGDCVDSCFNVNYPKDKYQVVVYCHNCTDNTAKIAREHGARVIEIVDKDPTHQKLSWNVYHGSQVLKNDPEGTHEFILSVDADNQLDKEYLNACNDAADSGVIVGRTFENSKNLTDNILSCMSGLWYARDDRFACRGRSALNFGCVMNGCSSMIRADYYFKWDAFSASEDIEFTINRLLKDNIKVEFIDKAVVYADQPTTLDDVFKRNTRMGNGLNKLFWSTGIKLLPAFFKNLFRKDLDLGTKLTFLDQYFNIATIPAAFLAIAWFPLYYIYTLIYTGITGPIYIYGLGYFSWLWFLLFIVIVIGAVYLVPFWLQPLVSYIAEKKRLVITNKKTMYLSIIFFPTFMIINAVAIVKGIISKPKWEKIKRSKTKIQQ